MEITSANKINLSESTLFLIHAILDIGICAKYHASLQLISIKISGLTKNQVIQRIRKKSFHNRPNAKKPWHIQFIKAEFTELTFGMLAVCDRLALKIESGEPYLKDQNSGTFASIS